VVGKPIGPMLASTWERSTVSVIDVEAIESGALAKAVEDAVESFANDWLATHPQ